MSATATLAGLPTSADPPDRSVPDTPNLTLLLGFLHTLLGIGKTLLDTLQDPARRLNPLQRELRFQTTDLRLILARIIRGLHRLTALQERLARQAATGRDLAPTPPHPPRQPGGGKGGGGHAGGGDTSPPPPEEEDPALILSDAALERILAEAASRPVGAVLVEICRDLGITPGTVDHDLTIAAYHAIRQYGGSVARWLRGVGRARRAAPAPHPAAAPPRPAAPAGVPPPSSAPPPGFVPVAAGPP